MRVRKFATFFGLSWIAATSVAADHLEEYLDPNQQITFDLAQNDPLVSVQEGFLLLEGDGQEVIAGGSMQLIAPVRELNAENGLANAEVLDRGNLIVTNMDAESADQRLIVEGVDLLTVGQVSLDPSHCSPPV